EQARGERPGRAGTGVARAGRRAEPGRAGGRCQPADPLCRCIRAGRPRARLSRLGVLVVRLEHSCLEVTRRPRPPPTRKFAYHRPPAPPPPLEPPPKLPPELPPPLLPDPPEDELLLFCSFASATMPSDTA